MHKATRHIKKLTIGIIGSIVLVIGIIAIPYPGPGWLIVFAGLAILSTEFDWAQRLLDRARAKYDVWMEWVKRQPWPVRLGLFMMTTAVVILTIYLFNGYGYLNDFFKLDYNWLQSPLPFFS